MPRKQPPPRRLFPLDEEELEMLRAFPYEKPGRVRGTREVKMAQRLIGVGLLESDPAALGPLVVRCTSAGEAEAGPLTRAEAERQTELVIENSAEDPEAAASLERALWQRVLAEVANAPLVSRSTSELARVALRTARYLRPR